MPAAAAIAGGAISAGTSIFQTLDANKRAKEAQKQLEEYQRQELSNPYENLQVSTMGADLQREDFARQMATNSAYAALGGSRAIMGLAPQMMQQQMQQEAQIAAGLDQQYNQNQMLAAKGNEMLQNMKENREQQDLMGIGNALNVARQERANGINNIVQTGVSIAKIATLGKGGQNASPGTQMPLTPIPQKKAGLIIGEATPVGIEYAQRPTYQAPNYFNQIAPIPSFGTPSAYNPYMLNPYKIY